MTVKEVMEVIARDSDYYRTSGGEVTFSGGEPFMQREGLLALLQVAKESGFTLEYGNNIVESASIAIHFADMKSTTEESI